VVYSDYSQRDREDSSFTLFMEGKSVWTFSWAWLFASYRQIHQVWPQQKRMRNLRQWLNLGARSGQCTRETLVIHHKSGVGFSQDPELGKGRGVETGLGMRNMHQAQTLDAKSRQSTGETQFYCSQVKSKFFAA